MSIRHIPGLIYHPIPHHVSDTCAFCQHPGVKVEARSEPKPRARYRPGITICGGCWEDRPEEHIRLAVELFEGLTSSKSRPNRRTAALQMVRDAIRLVAEATACPSPVPHINPLDPSPSETRVHTTAECGWCGGDVLVRG